MRSVTVGAILWLVVLVAAGCDPYIGSGPAAIVEPPASLPSPPIQERPIMAMVNGRPIYMEELHHHLVASFGSSFAGYLIDFELVRQAADAQRIELTDADIADEHERTLLRMGAKAAEPAEREQLLNQVLQQRGMTREQYDLWLKGRTLMRKLAQDAVEVTDQDVQDEFNRQYGRQVQVRTIQTSSLAGIEQIRQLLTDGEDFATLAQEYSDHPSSANGGLLPPINARSVDVPVPVRDVAITLTDEGQISDPIRVGDAYQVLQLVKVYESREADFEAVKSQLRQDVRERKILYLQESILLQLRRKADIQIVDPALSRQATPVGQS